MAKLLLGSVGGIALLSLDNLVCAVSNLFIGSIATYNIAKLKSKYANTCSEGGTSETCKILLEKMAENEYLISLTPLLNAVGIALIISSVVGMRAACTGDPKHAKLYMKIFPFLIMLVVVMAILRGVMAPSTMTERVQVKFFVSMFFLLYYCKVTWSFYKRRKVMEDMQLATDASSQGHTINLPLTQAPTIV